MTTSAAGNRPEINGSGDSSVPSMSFEVLDFTLVLFGLFEGVERSEVALFSGGGIFLSGVEAVFSGF
jgi:hypothetical protein